MAKNILIQATISALWLIVSANNLDIDVQPQFVRPNDKNVMISCSFGQNPNNLLPVYRMRLMRLDDDDQWSDVAIVGLDGSIDVIDESATADGILGHVLDSYLHVTWPVAPDAVNSRYRCDAVVLTSAGDVLKVQSRDLDVKGLSTDLSLLLERLKKSEKNLVEKVNDTMYDAMGSSKTNLFSVLESKFEELKEYLNNRTAVLRKTPGEDVETMNWPEEEFTLLMPNAGCPLHPSAWTKSFKKMKADPEDKYYPLDVPLHLAHPHKKDGFIYRQFCTLAETSERTEPWPAGSYCLYSLSKDTCPSGFRHSVTQVKIQSDDKNFYLYYSPTNAHTYGIYSVSVTRFCCRHDGSALSPIELPTSHPFYLFRHGGRCQEVKGMHVTQDVFMMETVDDANYNKWTDSNKEYHPDLSFQPYKEELCYYSKSRH